LDIRDHVVRVVQVKSPPDLGNIEIETEDTSADYCSDISRPEAAQNLVDLVTSHATMAEWEVQMLG
jgi:hypothetical protein